MRIAGLLNLTPTDANAFFILGLALFKNGQLEEAIDAYRKAAELDTKNARVYFNLGNALNPLSAGHAHDISPDLGTSFTNGEKHLRAHQGPHSAGRTANISSHPS